MCQFEECLEEFYYKTGRIFIFCMKCGYFKDTATGEEQEGKGIVKFKSGIGYEVYTIPFNENERKEFLHQISVFQRENPTIEVIINHYSQ